MRRASRGHTACRRCCRQRLRRQHPAALHSQPPTAVLSSFCPYGAPSDMLMTSTASSMEPSPFGSSAKSMTLQDRHRHCSDVVTALQTFTANSDAPARRRRASVIAAATDDVRDVRAMAAGSRSDRVRCARRRACAARPRFADEVVATDDLGRGEQTIRRRVARIGVARAVRGCVRRQRAGAAEIASACSRCPNRARRRARPCP